MKTANLPSFCILMLTFLVSCNNDDTATKVDNTTTTAIPNTRSISSMTSSSGLNNNATSVSASTGSASTATGINPAHGEPNHRCDIAVGAPLNSAPTSTSGLNSQSPVSISPIQGNAPVQVNAPVISNPAGTVKPNTTSVAAGINPAHGQPNHRCDIAVGAPLNSTPTKTTPIETKPTVSSVKPAPATTTTTVAPGMNPPHGQPNHRCDIAVGALLTSAPTKKATTAPAVTTTPAQITSPIQPLQNNTKSNAKLNPAHGQSGHDCAIAVGQPLKN